MLTVLIPVYNEAESLEELLGEIDDVARAEGYDLEVILVDDGSTDNSWDIIARQSALDDRVRGIRFRGNFGKAAARHIAGGGVFTSRRKSTKHGWKSAVNAHTATRIGWCAGIRIAVAGCERKRDGSPKTVL